jgi:hypothetical protein
MADLDKVFNLSNSAILKYWLFGFYKALKMITGQLLKI